MALRRKISKSEISQSYDLEKLLGKKPTQRQKELFFELAVDKMVDRTVSGKDIDNKTFTKYSEKYADKKGVPRDAVDLVLNGDMLNSIEDATTKKNNRVKIEIDEPELLKAYNHSVGDTLPKRDFFGFKDKKDLDSIINIVKRVEPEQDEQQPEPEPQEATIDLAELRAAVEQVGITFEDFE